MSLFKTLHKCASPFLYKTGIYQKLWQTRSRDEPFAFVVIYHRVVADKPDGSERYEIEKGISARDFEQQMLFLRRHFIPAKASRIQAGLEQGIRFAVTLDDGYEDSYRVAAPILKKLGIPATFYVVSDFVGTDRLFWWEQIAEILRQSDRTELDMQAVSPAEYPNGEHRQVLPLRSHAEREFAYSLLCAGIRNGAATDVGLRMKQLVEYFGIPQREQGRRYKLMGWQQLRDLVGQGFEIGGHTASHCNVIGADETRLQRELLESVNVIETKLDTPVESFAYPYGMFESSNQMVAGFLGKAHCKAAFTTVQGVVNADMPAYELPRIKLNRPYHFACAFNLQDTLYAGLPAA
jgi:peptidoglycan/xylan/chitin deacetylase (PgdA/CDA1 family)